MTKVIDQTTGLEVLGKTCSKCGEWKLLSEYHKHSGRKFGVRSACIQCLKILASTEEKRKIGREWMAEYRRLNPEKAKEQTARWREENREKLLLSRRNSEKKKNSTDKGRLSNSVKAGVHRGLKRGSKAGRRTFDLLGYSLEDLMSCIEAKFEEGMGWDNYGEWHIDHVIPLAVFNYKTPDDFDFKRAWALSNLQPLWASHNLSKNARLEASFQPSFSF